MLDKEICHIWITSQILESRNLGFQFSKFRELIVFGLILLLELLEFLQEVFLGVLEVGMYFSIIIKHIKIFMWMLMCQNFNDSIMTLILHDDIKLDT